jgi:hypothetical protein
MVWGFSQKCSKIAYHSSLMHLSPCLERPVVPVFEPEKCSKIAYLLMTGWEVLTAR